MVDMTQSKHFINNEKDNGGKSVHGKAAFLFKLFVTLGAWSVLSAAALWIFGAVGWFFVATFWVKELFIPSSVLMTVFMIALIFLWAVLLMVITFLWSRYNYCRYYRHNKRKLLPLKISVSLFDWQEMLWDNSRDLEISSNTDDDAGSGMLAVIKKVPVESTQKVDSSAGRHLMLEQPIRDKDRMVIVRAGEELTEEDLTKAYRSGYYVQLVSTLSSQLESEKNNGIF